MSKDPSTKELISSNCTPNKGAHHLPASSAHPTSPDNMIIIFFHQLAERTHQMRPNVEVIKEIKCRSVTTSHEEFNTWCYMESPQFMPSFPNIKVRAIIAIKKVIDNIGNFNRRSWMRPNPVVGTSGIKIQIGNSVPIQLSTKSTGQLILLDPIPMEKFSQGQTLQRKIHIDKCRLKSPAHFKTPRISEKVGSTI